MIEIKLQKPYIDGDGNVRDNLEKHYAEDESGTRYKIMQNETGIIYNEAIDVSPCRYTYRATNELVETTNESKYLDGVIDNPQ